MTLNPEQQRIAVEASKLVPICVRVFYAQLPCLRQVARICDLESAALLACCKAARTYDPARGVGISAYFSVAIKNAMLREVQKEIRTQSHSVRRISLDEAERRASGDPGPGEVAIPALMKLTEEERRWIEDYVFDGKSLRSFGRSAKCDPRTAKKTLRSHLARLKRLVEDQP